jgi:uncharacterized membrane protein
MEDVEKLLSNLQLHPVADHFTIALITIAILADILASIIPARTWIRHMALTLMVLGAIAAAASYATGDIEVDRVWKMMSPAAREYFKGTSAALVGHGRLGYYLMFVFGLLALWRILLALFAFMAPSRPAYLIVGIVSVIVLLYQGHTGGELVYEYGVGTGAMEAGASPQALPATVHGPSMRAAPAASAAAAPIPTVFVPSAAPTPAEAAPSPSAPAASATPTPSHVSGAGGAPATL